MRAAVLKQYKTLPEYTTNFNIPILGKGQALIKMAYSPINPSDLNFMNGVYGIKKDLPIIPGFEGSGWIVKTNSDNIKENLQGKKVAVLSSFTGHGTYSEYIVTDLKYCVPLDQNIDLLQGACTLINPLTSLMMREICKKNKHNAVVMTAGYSTLARTTFRILRRENINVINIVRNDDYIKKLESLGSKLNLNSSHPEFEEQLANMVTKYNATCLFDCVSGKMPAKILSKMPNHSEAYIYGRLSGENLSDISPMDLLFRGIKIQGLWVHDWVKNKDLFFDQEISKLVNDNLHQKVFYSDINKVYSLDKIGDAIASVKGREGDPSKVLLECHKSESSSKLNEELVSHVID